MPIMQFEIDFILQIPKLTSKSPNYIQIYSLVLFIILHFIVV